MPEEIKQEVVLKTQKYLGKFVKKPQLTDKLLKKPPFRFLHDIINAVIRETGFLKGLYTEEELNSENVKEREAKVLFLTKLIDAVKTITKTDLSVRASKIVAGLEPTETNLLLQAIGKAIEKKLDSSEYIKQLHSGEITNEKNKKNKRSSDRNENKTNERGKKVKDKSKNEKPSPGSNNTPISTDRNRNKRSTSNDTKNNKQEKPKKSGNVEIKEEAGKIEEPQHPNKPEESATIIENASQVDEAEEVKEENVLIKEEVEMPKRRNSASRPKSARPRSGEMKEVEKPVLNRPQSSLRPPSVRPSSARPGAPRLRPESALVKEVVTMGKINVIVENFDKDGDEEETVVIQNNPDIPEEGEHSVSIAEVSGDNKGHLVEQILEQIQDGDGEVAPKLDMDWQKEGILVSKETTSKETNNLRSLIQNLTKTANPLGKLLNYLHEDIDAMHGELEMWTNTKRQLFGEIRKQKKISVELNKPLMAQLDHLSREIKKMEEEIVNTRSNILKNDLKIKQLLSK